MLRTINRKERKINEEKEKREREICPLVEEITLNSNLPRGGDTFARDDMTKVFKSEIFLRKSSFSSSSFPFFFFLITCLHHSPFKLEMKMTLMISLNYSWVTVLIFKGFETGK